MNHLLDQLLRRIAQLVLTVVATSTVIFVLIHAAGDPTQGFLQPGASPEARTQVRARLELDAPLWKQYLGFLGRTFRFDFGDSWRDRQPALDAVLQRLPSTLLLAATATLLAVTIGVTLALVVSALKHPILRRVVDLGGLLAQGVPAFWLGTILILVFAVRLQWLPASGKDGFSSLVLPAFTLAAYPASIVYRLLAAELAAVERQPYIATARSKGLPERVVRLRHALPNAATPALAYLGVQLGFLVGGTVVVESVFAYPGVGRLALQAASERDLPVVHAFAVIVAIMIVAIGVGIDLLAAFLDPRLSQGQERRFT
ncbi:MAG: ABC transporter permease [Thermomicrobiales bacterium]